MAKPQQKQLMLYANLMEEVKVRFDCINHAAQGFTGLRHLLFASCYISRFGFYANSSH